MKLELVTWAGVRPGGAPPSCRARTPNRELQDLLSEHASNLLSRIQTGSTPEAEFITPTHRGRFETLTIGTKPEFLTTATELARELHKLMDPRMKVGLFVAARLSAAKTTTVGVFKLDVTDQYAGAIGQDPGGDEVLRAVRNLLETPKGLQKAAVMPDPRQASEVVVGDKLPDTAQYFLDALGIRQAQRTDKATITLINIVANSTGTPPDKVAASVAASKSSKPEEVIKSLQLGRPQRDQILSRLSEQRRPIREVNPTVARALRKVFKGDGITVRGSLRDMQDRVSVSRRDDGKWILQVVMEERPQESIE
jgi:hypothetical protein